MTIDTKLVDQLLKDYQKPEDLIGETGLLEQLAKALLERALSAEMNEHLGYAKHEPAGRKGGNSRNGTSSKTLKTEQGPRADRGTPLSRRSKTES